jgi:hypothetical protein
MFIIKYVLVILYCTLTYKLSRSERSFNNWLFDYIIPRDKHSLVKSCGIQWLLLSFEDGHDHETLRTCLDVFHEEIQINAKLEKISRRIKNNIELF